MGGGKYRARRAARMAAATRRKLKETGGQGIISLSGALKVLGALNDKNDPDGERREAHAERFYEALRRSAVGPIVQKLSKNGGISLKAARKVYQHVFLNEYELHDGVHRFPPSFDMAQSFQRLLSGKNIQAHDLMLLRHEWLEYGLMKRYGYDYDTAHRLTERKYNYALALKNLEKGRRK